MLLATGIGLLALFVVGVALVRRRRAASAMSLALRTRVGPAGVNHLAASVSELSDLGFHLRATATPRRRLGALLGLR
jgi:hypothetical protein